MRTLTVRLPDALAAEIEDESNARNLSKSDVIRERLQSRRKQRDSDHLASIADLIGSVKGLPEDLSSRAKHYLQATGYGKQRSR
jgi:Arc/MetJ-type ribon-helix-helix transcriptional regulator